MHPWIKGEQNVSDLLFNDDNREIDKLGKKDMNMDRSRLPVFPNKGSKQNKMHIKRRRRKRR